MVPELSAFFHNRTANGSLLVHDISLSRPYNHNFLGMCIWHKVQLLSRKTFLLKLLNLFYFYCELGWASNNSHSLTVNICIFIFVFLSNNMMLILGWTARWTLRFSLYRPYTVQLSDLLQFLELKIQIDYWMETYIWSAAFGLLAL